MVQIHGFKFIKKSALIYCESTDAVDSIGINLIHRKMLPFLIADVTFTAN